MFARASTLLLALVASVIAAPNYSSSSQCDEGSVQCCNNTHDPSQYNMPFPFPGLIGTGCTVGSAGCSQQAVCCNNNEFNGPINVGCTPINVNA